MESPNMPIWHPAVEEDTPSAAIDSLCGFGGLSSFDFSFCDFNSNPTFTPQLPTTFSSPVRIRKRAAIACIPCRRRHAKCDARSPVCSQCHENGQPCSYAESRRGRAKLGQARPSSSGRVRDLSPPSRCDHVGDRHPEAQNSPLVEQPSVARTVGGLSTSTVNVNESVQYLSDYYTTFHGAHPIVLPLQFFMERLQRDGSSLQYLLPVMQFVGSFYVSKAPKGSLRAQAEAALADDNLPSNGFTVQALLIFAIAVHASHEFVRAREILDHAIREALLIEMQTKLFASIHGEGCAVLEESWRRTWWFLYLTDGVFAGIRHCSTFTLYDVAADVDLPCEEESYQLGDIPNPRTLEEYSTREFLPENVVFSSFTYLIDMALNIGPILEILRSDNRDPFAPEFVSADVRLMNWISYLPERKRLMTAADGTVDEIMFYAHVCYNVMRVHIHRPLSLLAYSPIERTSKCAPPPSAKLSPEQQHRVYDFHTTKVLEAAEAGIGLFTLPGAFTSHSPMVLCGLTLSLLAELSACRFHLKGEKYTAARERVRFGLSVIKAISTVWPIGGNTLDEVTVIAKEILGL